MRNNKKQFLIIGIILSLLTIPISASINTSNTNLKIDLIDQSQEDTSQSQFLDGMDWQQFTHSSGTVTRIDVHIGQYLSSSNPITLSVESTLNATPLTEATLPASGIPSGQQGWVDFDVIDVELDPNQQYFLVLRFGFPSDYAWSGTTGDPYANGISSVGSDWDYAFRTYVLDVNNPPDIPEIPLGPATGVVGTPYSYSTSASDPDDDTIRYGWEWTGDEMVDGWTNFYPSGSTSSVSLVFDSVGTYDLRVKAEDEHGAQSDWSDPIQVVIGTSSDTGTFIGHFMTPEGEPYPFDVIISDGMWVQEFNQVTFIDTEVPPDATYTIQYGDQANGEFATYTFSPDIAVGEVKEYDFFAVDVENIDNFQPYILAQETDITDVIINYDYNEETGDFFLNYSTTPTDRVVHISIMVDSDLSSSPHILIKNFIDINGDVISPDYYYPNITLNDTGKAFDYSYTCKNWSTKGYADIEIGPLFIGGNFDVTDDSNIIGIRGVSYNKHELSTYDFVLQKVETEELMDPGYIYPQFYLPSGNEGDYILTIFDLPDDYVGLRYPVQVAPDDYMVFDAYSLKVSDIVAFDFGVTGEYQVQTSQFSDLIDSYLLSVNVSSPLLHPWWGYFVLPAEYTVETLMAYDDDNGLELSEEYEYTINHVDDYNIVCVRISPGVDNLELAYTGNNPPGIPSIDGPSTGKAGENLTYVISTTDSENDAVSYVIDWGDTVTFTKGYYKPGEGISFSHSWEDEGDYTVQVKAVDSGGAESDWGTLEMSISKGKGFFNPFLRFFENHQHLYLILQQIFDK